MATSKHPKPDKHTAFCYSFKPRELKYFLFGKKICPNCGGALKKCKGYVTLNDEMPHSRDDCSRIDTSSVKYYRYSYSCAGCGSVFTLEELAEGK